MVARSATRVDRRTLLLIVGLLTLAALAGVLYLSQAGVAAELRYRLYAREDEARALWEQNLMLKRAIADADRLEVAEAQANRLGMVTAPAGGSYVAVAVPEAAPAVAARPASTGQAVGDVSYLERLAAELGWDRLDQILVLNAEHH